MSILFWIVASPKGVVEVEKLSSGAMGGPILSWLLALWHRGAVRSATVSCRAREVAGGLLGVREHQCLELSLGLLGYAKSLAWIQVAHIGLSCMGEGNRIRL